MRDAFGGAFMIRILLLFMAVFIVFVAVALNYAKAFRVKNKIIDVIEQNEGVSLDDTYNVNNAGATGPIVDINNYLGSVRYNVTSYVDENLCKNNINNNIYEVLYYDDTYGYCIGYKDVSDTDNRPYITSEYYQVVTFVIVEIPLFRMHFEIPIKGETRKIERINS